MKLLANAEVYDHVTGFARRDVVIDGERIRDLIPSGSGGGIAETHDLAGCRLVPGFIDLHFHGAVGFDLMTADATGLGKICDYQARHGTTAFLAATLTAGMPELMDAVGRLSSHSRPRPQAAILGLHIEGPYINPKQKGCHRIQWMREPSVAEYRTFRERAGAAHLHFTVAPELAHADELIRAAVKDGATVAIGHTDATAVQTRRGLDEGASVFTHLYNAMRGLHHREPGVVGTALTSHGFVELICDGIHVAPEAIDLVYRAKGRDQIILVTDAMHAAGLGDGVYEFGGYKVEVRGGIARNEEGALASSTITLLDAVKNMMRFTGARLEDVIPMVTRNPARAIGIESERGGIEPGKIADIVVLDANLEIRAVWCAGRVAAA